MNILKSKDTIEVLLENIYKKNYTLDSLHSESLLRYLEDCLKSANKNAEIEFLSDMVMYSITHVEDLAESVHIFTLKFVTLAFNYQLPVIKDVKTKEFLTKCLEILKEENNAMQQHLSTIHLMTSLIPYRLGLDWIIEHKVWEPIIKKNYHRRWKKVADASYHLITDLVWKLDENNDEVALIEVLDFFIKPLIHNGYMNVETLDVDGDDELVIVDTLLPFVQILLTVLRDKDHQAEVNLVMSILKNQYVLECHMCLLADLSNNHDLCIILTEILYRIWSYNIRENPEEKQANDIPFELITLQNNYLYNIIYTKDHMFVFNALMTMNFLWLKMNKGNMSSIYEWNGKQYDFEIQLISLTLGPILLYVDKYCTDYEDMRCKLENILSEHTIKLAYTYRGTVKNKPKKLVIYSLKQYTRLVDHITDAQAGIMYEALHYILEIYGQTSNHNYETKNKIEFMESKNSLEDVQIIYYSLYLVKKLLLTHDINWYENVEITRLQNILVNLLKLRNIDNKLIMQILDVLEICVSKFLLPDLSLLLESYKGSAIQELGQLMAEFIQHEAWEIRDSTLNLLLTCIEISFVKYVPMRKIITDNKLLNLVVHLALSDNEMYVQANALKCLAATTTMESLWNSILNEYTYLIEDIIQIVSINHESLVRKEAANVLIKIYVNQQVTEGFNLKMYELMTKMAIEDLQWEVQITALNFWHHMIQTELNDRGMIDGTFPAVTFCKKKHKIIMLNDTEIHKKLSCIMTKLSKCGGLAVLHKCMNKDNHVQVIEKANTKNLVTILTKHNFQTDVDQDPQLDLGNDAESYPPVHEISEVHDDIIISEDVQNEIIDDILSKSLSELVIDISNHKTSVDVVDENAKDFESIMSVIDFLSNFHTNDTCVCESEQTYNSESEQLQSLKESLLNDSVANYTMECV